MPLLDCFVNELLIFANRLLPPAAMLPFDGTICVSLLQQCVSVAVASGEILQYFI